MASNDSLTVSPTVSIIVAAAENGVIGKDGELPWRLRDDLKRFKAITMSHPIIMGRATWESIGRPLPGRHNIVLTRQKEYVAEGATVVNSPAAALAAASAPDAGHSDNDGGEVMIIGGGDIYALFLPMAHRIYLTRVHVDVDGDAYFPALDDAEWATVDEEAHPASSDNEYPYSFVTLERDRG